MCENLCKECSKSKKCKKICKKVNQLLSKMGIKSANWIRPRVSKNQEEDGLGRSREIPFSSLGLDKDGEYFENPD